MIEFKNVILVSGSGRNCGKTTIACNIISHLSKSNNVIGLKISPHFHKTNNSQTLITEGIGYKIFKENDITTNKDSSRMLQAGANDVYFVLCDDDNILVTQNILKQLLPLKSAVVCESGLFAKNFKPGLHILVEGANPDKSKKSYKTNLQKSDIKIIFLNFEANDLSIEYNNLDYKFNYDY